MTTRRRLAALVAAMPMLALSRRKARAAAVDDQPPPAAPPGATDEFMLTVFLRHDETKTVDEINQHLKTTGWFRDFPPAGVTVVSWYVMMGIGQVVTLRLPPEKLRDLNRLIEGEAWGGYRTEFYPTYDYRGLYDKLRTKME